MSALDKSRDLVVRALGGRLLERLACGCEVYDVSAADGGGAVVVGADCELDHYRDVARLYGHHEVPPA